jgi:hypothetical protein
MRPGRLPLQLGTCEAFVEMIDRATGKLERISW